jgi:hypothetical protein
VTVEVGLYGILILSIYWENATYHFAQSFAKVRMSSGLIRLCGTDRGLMLILTRKEGVRSDGQNIFRCIQSTILSCNSSILTDCQVVAIETSQYVTQYMVSRQKMERMSSEGTHVLPQYLLNGSCAAQHGGKSHPHMAA